MLTSLAWACAVYAAVWAIASVVAYFAYKACMPAPGVVESVVTGFAWPLFLGIFIGMLCVWLYSKVDPYPADEADEADDGQPGVEPLH